MSVNNWEKLARLTDNNAEIRNLVDVMCMASFHKGVDSERGKGVTANTTKVIAEFGCRNSAGSAVVRSFGGDYVVTTKIGASEHHQAFSDIDKAMDALNVFIEYCGESKH